jgi:hypothetical protein
MSAGQNVRTRPDEPSARRSGSTVPAVVLDAESLGGRGARAVTWGRRVYVAALAGFILLGLLDVFGSRTGTAVASAQGYRLVLAYPATTRGGLPVEWRLSITHAGGFAGPVRVGVTLDWFNSFDFNNVSPTPVETSNDGGLLIWTFPRPRGDTLNVLLDARTQPGLRTGTPATASLLAADGSPIVAVRYTTGVMP